MKIENSPLEIDWTGAPKHWLDYAKKIVSFARKYCKNSPSGTLHIATDLPLGKGMGSSTSLIIAICRCLLGDDCRSAALAIEDTVNPGHSGLDFAVIWEDKPILFQRMKNDTLHVSTSHLSLFTSHFSLLTSHFSLLTSHFSLIDTGTPNEATPELVAWIKSRKDEPKISKALATIGHCTERLVAGEDLRTVMRDHHRAQVALGVVTPGAQKIIAEIEERGGAAKVLGAGARSGGCGMILKMA